jgi:hypothetical protein
MDEWMGGQTYIETDRHDKDNNNFLQFCKCAYKGQNCAVRNNFMLHMTPQRD